MTTNYSGIKDNLISLKSNIENLSITIDGKVLGKEKAKYPNPQLRCWNGDINTLVEFKNNLAEWLNHPNVAEAKRLLDELKSWSDASKNIKLDEIEKEWQFLSDNLDKIKIIHQLISGIKYDSIKKKCSDYVLGRILEKDIPSANNWAINARKFSDLLIGFDNLKPISHLAQLIKTKASQELLKTLNFHKDNNEIVDKYNKLVARADLIIKNKPTEIKESAILKSFKSVDNIETSLTSVSSEIETIKNYLINLEWVKDQADFSEIGQILSSKKAALSEQDLEAISLGLKTVVLNANSWKEKQQSEIEGILVRFDRILKNLDNISLKQDVENLKAEIQKITWGAPELSSLSKISSNLTKLRVTLQDELKKKLNNIDAVSIIEDPNIIRDFGNSKGWEFDRFIKALEISLRNGCLEIAAVETK